MPFWAYIIRSETTGKLYIGQTSDLENRIRRHNAEEPGSSRYTHKQMGPWQLIYAEEVETRGEAMKRKRYLKSGQGREWMRNNIKSK
jgi:putative endonuclease